MMGRMSDYYIPEQDDGQDAAAQQQLEGERRERSLNALYHAAMLGLWDDELAHLVSECGLTVQELRDYRPPILRVSNQPTGGDAQDFLPF